VQPPTGVTDGRISGHDSEVWKLYVAKCCAGGAPNAQRAGHIEDLNCISAAHGYAGESADPRRATGPSVAESV
jgi:hypothetical protein